MPVVLAIVTIVLPAVVMPDSATGVTAPQFVDTVTTSPCVNELPNPLNIDSKPACDNFDPAYVIALVPPDRVPFCKEAQLANKLVFVAADTFKNGTDDKEEQPENMLEKVVPLAVSKSGMVFKDTQPINILVKVVPDEVLSNGIVLSEVQFSNMLVKVVATGVFIKDIVSNELHNSNMLVRVIPEARFREGTVRRE